MYEPVDSAHGVYGDLRNSVERRRWRKDDNLLFAPGTGQVGGCVSAPVRRCHVGRPAELAVISPVVEPPVDPGA